MNKEQTPEDKRQEVIKSILNEVELLKAKGQEHSLFIYSSEQAEVTINALKKELAEDIIIEHGVNGSNHHSCPACHGYIVSMLIFTGVNNCPHCGKAVRYTPDKVEQFSMQMSLDSGIMERNK